MIHASCCCDRGAAREQGISSQTCSHTIPHAGPGAGAGAGAGAGPKVWLNLISSENGTADFVFRSRSDSKTPVQYRAMRSARKCFTIQMQFKSYYKLVCVCVLRMCLLQTCVCVCCVYDPQHFKAIKRFSHLKVTPCVFVLHEAHHRFPSLIHAGHACFAVMA